VPADYVNVLRTAVPEAVAKAGIDPADVIGIGTDFTACTMVPVLGDGTPLCELERFADRPHAFAKLWRHHSPQPQADRINAVAAERGESWLPRYGGLISSEWEFAKALEILQEDPEIYQAIDHWVEAADWIVWQLSGAYVRNACTAGYKGIRQDGQYPSREFLAAVHPDFADFVTEKLDHPLGQLGDRAGSLTAQAAEWTGLPEGIAVAVGNVDAHVTVAAADALDSGQLVAIMGTSTCHVMNSDVLREVPGMCGVVDGGILGGSWGYEAGQSGVGDIFAWFVENCVPERYHVEARQRGVSLHEYLTELAGHQSVGQHGLLALDWHSGNRSVLVDHELSGVIVGQTLETTCVDQYRALLEATAFGTRMIVQTFIDSGVPVTELVVAGGLLKNRLLMQIYADAVGLPLSTVPSTQAPALGAAIHAATAAGAFTDVRAAAKQMGRRTRNAYNPIPENVAVYDQLYREYVELYDWFGRGNKMMRRLRNIGSREQLGAVQ
jgi:L-ribulokinase